MNFPYFHSRNVHGILLLDKPKGLSSNNVLQKVKYIYDANRAGHSGSLDPLATGMLPIFFGEATKFSQHLINSDKRYQVIAKLGQKTDTADANGKVIQKRPLSFNKKQLDMVLESFRGKILQVPSMYSALKYQGKKFYEYARKGIEIPRKPRSIFIYELLFIRYEDTELELKIHCSKGTYIRTIIDDLGEKLGCGAHVIFLRRLNVGHYKSEDMVTLEKLQKLIKQAQEKMIPKSKFLDPLLMPVDSLITNYPIVNLPLILSSHFKNGKPVYIPENEKMRGLVRVTEGKKNIFIGTGKVDTKGFITPCRLIFKDLIESGVY